MVREDPERRAVQSRSYYREQVGEDLAGRISGHRLTGYPAKKGKANTGSHETCCHDLFLVPTLDQRLGPAGLVRLRKTLFQVSALRASVCPSKDTPLPDIEIIGIGIAIYLD